jgi:4-hydroxybenzoate polyprenyltransferase
MEVLREEAITVSRRWWGAPLWETMRPWQWSKNLFVLAPLFFSRQLFVPDAELRAVAAFLAFCAMSSAVYLLNDVLDRERDRLHPRKRTRPVAAGALSVRAALGAMALLLLAVLVLSASLDRVFTLILLGYWLLNVVYSGWLKRQVILDVLCVAAGFVLRVLGGGVVIHVEVSPWLLLCTMLLALFFALSKRRQELLVLGKDAALHRNVLNAYTPPLLEVLLGIVATATIMSYALYTVSEETARRFSTRGLVWTLPFVLYGLFRYLYLLYQTPHEDDPMRALLNDWPLLLDLGLWSGAVGIMIYWR